MSKNEGSSKDFTRFPCRIDRTASKGHDEDRHESKNDLTVIGQAMKDDETAVHGFSSGLSNGPEPFTKLVNPNLYEPEARPNGGFLPSHMHA